MVSLPRFTRPHTILIRHKIGEDNELNSLYEETTLRYVKFDDNKQLRQSSHEKRETSSAIIIIDCGDLYAIKNSIMCKYISSRYYKQQSGFFSIFSGDVIVFDKEEYVVNSINEINPFGKEPLFIEVICNV